MICVFSRTFSGTFCHSYRAAGQVGKTSILIYLQSELESRNKMVHYTEFMLYGGYPKIVLTDDVSTRERYLFLLEQTYNIRLMRPFNQNLRTELTKTPKVFFYDTGLMQMLWLKRLQREVLGPVFETCVLLSW